MIRMSTLFAIVFGIVAVGSVAASAPAAAFSGVHNEQMSVPYKVPLTSVGDTRFRPPSKKRPL